ncbi:Ataxin-2 [Heterocephalus glaber]|uniref:Sesquipedalian-1 n=1 Tax=Heterocephalus glaber TaxID=10181 RepID=G5AKU3_HETGA|nr:Ataxin-2 [Heterocephalus glaber]
MPARPAAGHSSDPANAAQRGARSSRVPLGPPHVLLPPDPSDFRGRNSSKGLPQSTISFDGIYANMRMVHILTSVVGSKCEVQVKNGGIYEGVFKTYSPKCDLVLDAAHEKSPESSSGPKREEIMESILFKCSDFVVVQFKDMDSSYARRDAFTDSAISAKVNGEHKEKDLEPWDAGELTASEELEALENDVSNGWDPNDMFRYNEENYGVVSTYDSSLSSYTVPLERDNSEEFLKREARANQLAEEIESSAQYKARVALENDDRSEEEKYTAVQRNSSEPKDSRLQDQRQNSPAGNKENIKPSETSPTFSKAENKGISPVVSEHRKQIDDLKKFKNDFRLQPSSTSESMDQVLNKNREGEKSRDLIKEKIEPSAKDSFIENSSNCTSGSSKPSSPSISPSILSNTEHKRGPEVTSQGVQTSGPACKQEKDDKEEKKDAAEQVRKSTLNPNAKEFNPRSFSQPLYPIPMTPMPVNQAKTYRAVPNMPQQRQDQHHQSTMMHPASAAGPPIVATPPAYSTQYVAYSPQQFPNQPLVQHMPHYQSQHPHVYSPVIQGNARMMAPPAHAQPALVSSSATQYGAHEQTHAMYVSTGSLAQQYAHPNATLHPHTPHPQPSATPTGQQQSQHGGSHPAPSPVQHHQHQAAQALHLASPQQQSAIYHAGLAPTPPSMTPASNTQSPQNSFPAAQQTVFTIHPSHVQPAYTNPPHMAHVPQAVGSAAVPVPVAVAVRTAAAAAVDSELWKAAPGDKAGPGTMKLNERSLAFYATCDAPVDHAGFLHKKGGRHTASHRRWFVLRGNMLFYFEGPGSREPLGVIVLEGCTVELVEAAEEFAFAVRFTGAHARCYALAAESQAALEGWVKALSRASFHYLRLVVRELEQQLAAMRGTGVDGEVTVPPRRPKENGCCSAVWSAEPPAAGPRCPPLFLGQTQP